MIMMYNYPEYLFFGRNTVMFRKISVKFLSLVLSAALLLSCLPVAMATESEVFSIATINDTHYYPEILAGNKKEAFYTYLSGHNCVYHDLDAILDASLESLEYEVEHNGVKHIVLVGDLTTNGEYEGHEALATKLLAFEQKTGASVYVTPGNHDINNSRASTFVNDKKEPGRITTPPEFAEIYKDLGFSDAYHQFTSFDANMGGSLSYSIKTSDGYRLILADGGKFTEDVTDSKTNEQETAGMFTPELLEWILAEAEDAKKDGEIPLLFTHWNMSGMNYFHEFLLQGFVIDDAAILQDVLADAGINYTFSGHQHVSDVNITYSDIGNPMYSVITPTLTQFPFSYRVTDFKKNSEGGLDVTFNMRSCDEYSGVKALSGNGNYPAPYRNTGFYKQFGSHADAGDYVYSILKSTLDKYINAIRAEGSIVDYVEKELEIDIEKTVDDLLFGGIKLDGKVVLSGENVMNFLDSLDKQLMERYIYQKTETYALIRETLEKVTQVQVSEYPCTKFIDTYGFGDTEKGGTLGDAVLSVLAYMYLGNEDISDDLFMQDFIEFTGTTEFFDLLIDTVKTYIVDDILVNNILLNISLDLGSFFSGEAADIGGYIQIFYALLLSFLDSGMINVQNKDEFIDALVKFLEGFGDVSLKKLVEAVLSTGLINYGTTIDGLIDSLLNQFLPREAVEATVYQAKIVIGGMVEDSTKDWDVTYTNNGSVEVIPTKEKMQLPVNVTLSMTEDNSTSFTVNWMTKYSVKGSDIEVVEKGEEFTGNPQTENVTAVTRESVYTAPGFDAGTINILPYEAKIMTHSVTVTGLEPDTEYVFRFGDFEKAFTCDSSVTTAPAEDGEFTFIHVSETGGMTSSHYETFGNVMSKADELYPDAAFTVHTGNLVTTPTNDDQWSWAIESAEETFASKPFVYSPGVNDIEGNYAVEKFFPVSYAPAQLTDSGYYYSYNYGNAHFIVLNTNAKTSGGTLTREQTSWLKNDLKASDKTWNILIMNESIYGSVTSSTLHTQIVSLMEEYGNIDLILQGSETAYFRTELLQNDRVIAGTEKTVTVKGKDYVTYLDEKGTVAVISGCTTDSFRDAFENDFTDTFNDTELPMFTAVTINGLILTVDAYTVDGNTVTEIDSFAKEKADTELIMGDIDFDGAVSSSDARLALRYSVGLEELSPLAIRCAMVNKDDVVSSADARLILRAAVGLEKFTPGSFIIGKSELTGNVIE